MKIVQKPITTLRFAGYNPRTMTDEQRKQLSESIERFGMQQPIIVNMHPKRKNIVIGGHQRVELAKGLKYKTLPCVEVKLSLAKEREFNIRLNKNLGEWDQALLEQFFLPADLIRYGFTKKELDFDLSGIGEDPGSKKPAKAAIVKCTLGSIRFEITRKQYIDWTNGVIFIGSKTQEQQVAIIKRLLRIPK